MTRTDQRTPASGPAARAAEQMARVEEAEERAAELAGVLNGAGGALVDLVADALAERLWEQWGIHSPAQWLAWKTGFSKGRAQMVVRIARRRSELPCAVEALRSGALSVDQVQLIAAHVPSAYDEAAVELARHTTVAQLAKVLPRYAWDTTEDDDPDDGAGSASDASADPAGDESKRRAWFGWDEAGEWGRLSASLPIDEAMALEAALKAARAELSSRHRADDPDGPVPWFDDADTLMELARSYLATGATEHPNRDRFLVHAHLEQHPDGTPVLRGHLGPVLPDALRRFVTCDSDVRPVFHTNGIALSAGRTQRLVPDRARKIIEQRDGGCVIPGCGRTRGLDVHHIVHWEDGGPTDTHNLCCLCRTHHRRHHLGLVGITGNADQLGGLVFTDRWRRPMAPSSQPRVVDASEPPETTAARTDIPVHVYRPATGERLRARDIWLSPAPTRAGPDLN